MKTTTKTTDTFYAWHWVGGGYNSCRASTREEAIAKGNAEGAPRKGGLARALVVNPATLVEGKAAEKFVAEQDRAYAGMFD